MNRQAQVTLFIILGITLLFIVGSALYYYNQVSVPPIERAIKVPADRRPVYDFVTQCVQDIAKTALVKLGLQGGYLTLPPAITRNPLSYLPLDPAGVARIPFWYYEGEDRTPTPKLMSHDLALRIRDNLHDCTADFSAFNGKYVIREKGPPTPEVTIAADNVIVKLTWPLELQSRGRTLTLDTYLVVLDVPLGRIYNLANRTMAAENRFMLFENLTMDLFAMHPDIPTDGMEFACGRKNWRLDNVKRAAQTALYYHIPRIRVKNTDHLPYDAPRRAYERAAEYAAQMEEALNAGAERISPPSDIPADTYEYFRMRFDVGTEPTDLRTAFVYLPEWDMRIAAQPHDGGRLPSSHVLGSRAFLPFFCINQWHFTYNVIYPVLAVVKSPAALNGAGYTFQFAFPVLINRNHGEREYFGLRRFNPMINAMDFCSNLGDKTVEVRARGAVENSPVGLELENVNITLECGSKACLLGRTRADEGKYRLRAYLPEGCGNPLLRAQKEGYLDAVGYLGDAQDITLDLKRLREMQYTVRAHSYNPASGEMTAVGVPLPAGERAHIRISAAGLDEFREFPARPDERSLQLIESKTLYDIDVFLSDANGKIVGGYRAINLSLSGAEVAGASTIEFHALHTLPNDENQRTTMLTAIFKGEHNEQLRPVLR